MCNMSIITNHVTFLYLAVITLFNLLQILYCRPVDYIAPVNPCRLKDRFCSVNCQLWQMKGDLTCDFCVCHNKDDYVKWETTPASTLSPLPTTTLPPDTIVVNNIRYHKVGDPCQLSRDRMCPSTCTELHSTKQDGSVCTVCDCHGAAVIIG